MQLKIHEGGALPYGDSARNSGVAVVPFGVFFLLPKGKFACNSEEHCKKKNLCNVKSQLRVNQKQ